MQTETLDFLDCLNILKSCPGPFSRPGGNISRRHAGAIGYLVRETISAAISHRAVIQMTDNAEAVLNPKNVFRALRRHARKAIAFFVCANVLVVAALLFWPRTYRSEGRLFVRLGRESVTLDPTATTGQTIAVNESREVEINSIEEVLKGRAIAEKVVDALGPDTVLATKKSSTTGGGDDDSPSWTAQAIAQLKSLSGSKPVSDREQAATVLMSSLKVWVPKKTSVVCVQYEAETPELAQQVVATLINKYLEEHARVNRTAGSHDFFVEQSKLLEVRLRQAQDELRDAKNSMGLTTIEGQRRTLQDEIGAIELQLISTVSELSASEAKADDLARTIDGLPERLVTQDVSGFPNVAADGMREVLYQLQVRERELRAKFTDEHPQVMAIREQVNESQAILDAQQVQRTQSTSAVHPGRQQLELTLLNEQAHVASLRARAQSLQTQHVAVLDKLKTLNNDEVRIAQMARSVDMAETNYRTYADKLELARIDQQLESERISNVNVVQPASYMAKAARPNRLLVLVLGVMVATLGALGVALLAEYLDRSLKTPEEVERRLERTVLISTPAMSPREALAN
jgi:uncharacterized protein involved in exopolysaccharide biosynthesis